MDLLAGEVIQALQFCALGPVATTSLTFLRPGTEKSTI